MARVKNILVVDDDMQVRTMHQTALEQAGMQVQVVADGEAALAALEGHEYDLVLLDIMLPKIDGFEVLKFICEKENQPEVIVFSSLSEDKVRERVQDMGVKVCYNKAEILPGEVVEMVKNKVSNN